MMGLLILFSVLFVLTIVQIGHCDPYHPHLMTRPAQYPGSMTELCNRHKKNLEMDENRHLANLKYSTCASQVSMEKYKRQQNECQSIMCHKDIGYCLAPEKHQNKIELIKKCLGETSFNEEESKKIDECMGRKKAGSKRRKRDLRFFSSGLSNFTQVCDITMVGYYLNHPSHFEAHHSCTVKVIGNDRVDKRLKCQTEYPIKDLDDFNKKCKSPEDHKEEFDSAMECYKKNEITPEERKSIWTCTFQALQDLDNEYVIEALLFKPFKDLDSFCTKSRNYWLDGEEVYKNKFDACSMKINPTKTETRWACDPYDRFTQMPLEKCVEKQEGDSKKMVTCMESNKYTPEEEEKIKVCLTESQVEWLGVPKVPQSIEENCGYTLLRWFGYNPAYYRFFDECSKQHFSPEEYSKFHCDNILTIKTNQELTEVCKNPGQEHKASYLKYRECREQNEPPPQKFTAVIGCSMMKMINHITEMKKLEDEVEQLNDPELM